METKVTKRIEWLDIIKGVAIICVVFEHACERTELFIPIENKYLLLLRDAVLTFQMAVFFSVSGFLYSEKDREKLRLKNRTDLKSFIYKKTMDLFLPYVIFEILIYIGKTLFAVWVKHPVDFMDLVTMLVRPISFAWFLYALYAYEIIAAVLDYLSPKYAICIFTAGGDYIPIRMS